MNERSEPWVVVASYSAIWEADFAAETLREAGIPAHVERGQNVGVFGMGYQGHTQFGVKLRVPWHREREARDLLEVDLAAGDDVQEPI